MNAVPPCPGLRFSVPKAEISVDVLYEHKRVPCKGLWDEDKRKHRKKSCLEGHKSDTCLRIVGTQGQNSRWPPHHGSGCQAVSQTNETLGQKAQPGQQRYAPSGAGDRPAAGGSRGPPEVQAGVVEGAGAQQVARPAGGRQPVDAVRQTAVAGAVAGLLGLQGKPAGGRPPPTSGEQGEQGTASASGRGAGNVKMGRFWSRVNGGIPHHPARS